jgi:hypothetical protein
MSEPAVATDRIGGLDRLGDCIVPHFDRPAPRFSLKSKPGHAGRSLNLTFDGSRARVRFAHRPLHPSRTHSVRKEVSTLGLGAARHVAALNVLYVDARPCARGPCRGSLGSHSCSRGVPDLFLESQANRGGPTCRCSPSRDRPVFRVMGPGEVERPGRMMEQAGRSCRDLGGARQRADVRRVSGAYG